jgi:predicted DCC family thiol-disulfide oxidoreductase YuxK
MPGTVYFDGYCGLCDRFVTFLVKRDRHRALRFAPLQGETAAGRFAEGRRRADDPASVIYEDAAGVHTRSTAALRALGALGGAWSLLRILELVPRVIRDAVYDWVARHRFRWFGRRESCRLPGPGEGEVFLP